MIIYIFTCFLSCVEAVSKSGSKFINCRWITLEIRKYESWLFLFNPLRKSRFQHKALAGSVLYFSTWWTSRGFSRLVINVREEISEAVMEGNQLM